MKRTLCILALASSFVISPGLWAGNSAFASEPPPVSGWMEQFVFADPPRPAPETPFLAGNGAEVTIKDFAGRVLLVNFWATWCAPCIRELPQLDALQGRLGDEGLLVLAVSQDRGGAAVAGPFLKKLGVTRLGLFLDPRLKLGRAFGVQGLPWSVLVGRDGRTIGHLAGYTEWDSEEGVALLRHYLGQPASEKVEKAKCACQPGPARTFRWK